MIRAIYFDFGGVFIESQFAAIDQVAQDMGVEPALLQRITFGDYHEDSQHPWHRLERGEISLDQTRELIILEGERHGLKTDIYEMLARFAGVERQMCMPLIDKVREWKGRGLKTGMITNNIREFTSWKTAFPLPLEQMFDVVADSSALGMRKPGHGIYLHALQQLGVQPQEAIFLDDYPANIEAARQLGMHGVLVEGPIGNAIACVEALLKP